MPNPRRDPSNNARSVDKSPYLLKTRKFKKKLGLRQNLAWIQSKPYKDSAETLHGFPKIKLGF